MKNSLISLVLGSSNSNVVAADCWFIIHKPKAPKVSKKA